MMMYSVIVQDLQLYGYHGVNLEEKKNGQPFLFDIKIEIGDKDFLNDDNIGATLNYSEVVDTVKEVNSSKKFDLVETLAQAIASSIFARFTLAEKVRVSIKKTKPPIKEKLSGVGVACVLERRFFEPSSCFLSLGSNVGDRMSNLQNAVKSIAANRGVSLEKMSSVYSSEPMHVKEQEDFLNMVILLGVSKYINPFEFLGFLKSIEHKLGRTGYKKRYGPRPIDIDIIYWEGIQIKSHFLTLPHPRFTKRNFVLKPLSEIKPDFTVKGKNINDYIREKEFSEKVEKLDKGLQIFDIY